MPCVEEVKKLAASVLVQFLMTALFMPAGELDGECCRLG